MIKPWLICGCTVVEIVFASVWTPVLDNKWGSVGNWIGDIPGLPGNDTVAVFPFTIPSVGLNVLLQQGINPLDVSLSHIQFYNGYVISSGFGQISSLPATPLSIAVNANAMTEIGADLTLASMQSLQVAVSSGSFLTISGTATLANASLVKTGGGTLVIAPNGAILNPGLSPFSQTLDVSGGLIKADPQSIIQCQNMNNNHGALLRLLDARMEVNGVIGCVNSGLNGSSTLDIGSSELTGVGSLVSQNDIADGSAFVFMDHTVIDGGLSINCQSLSSSGNLLIDIETSTLSLDGGQITAVAPVGPSISQIVINDSTISLTDQNIFQCNSYVAGIEIHNSIIDSAAEIGSLSPVGSFLKNQASLFIDHSRCFLNAVSFVSSVNTTAPDAESSVILQNSYVQGLSSTIEAGSVNGSGNGSSSLDIQDSTMVFQGVSVLNCNQESPPQDGQAAFTIGASHISSHGSLEVSCQNNSTLGGSSLLIENSQVICEAGNILCENTGHGDHMHANLNIENSTMEIDSGSISCGGSGVNFLDVTIAISQSHLNLGSCGIHCESTANGSSNNSIFTMDESTVRIDSGEMRCDNLGSGDATFAISGSDVMLHSLGIGCSTFDPAGIGTLSIANSTVHLNAQDLDVSCEGNAQVLIDSSTLLGVRNIVCNSLSEESLSVITNSHVFIENEISSVANSNAALTIENHTMLTGTGSVFCISGNVFPSTLLIEDSSCNLTSGEIRCTAGEVGLANLTMDHAMISLQSGNIISESITSLAGANLQINDSTIVLQDGLMRNTGDPTSVFNMINSTVTIGPNAEIRSIQNLEISQGLIRSGGIVQSLGGSILIQDGAQVLNSGIFGNASRDISVVNSSLFSSGTVLAATYTQNSSSVLDISISTNQIHGLVSANNVSLDGRLLIGFSEPDIILGNPIAIVISETDFSSRFSSHQFVDTPSFLSPYLFYSPNQVFVEFQSSPVLYKTLDFQGIAVIENTMRLEREMAFVHTRLRHQQFPSLLADISKDGSHIVHNDTVTVRDSHSLLAQERPLELLAQKIEEEPKRPFNVYLGPIGSVGSMNKREGQFGNSFGSIGVLGGFDYAAIPESLPFGFGLGTLFSYSSQYTHVAQHAGKSNADFVHGNLYAVVVPKSVSNLSVNGSLGGGYEWVQMHRLVKTGSSSVTAKAKTKGPEIDALIGLQYIIADDVSVASPGLRLTFPVFYLQYLHTSLNRFKEQGAGIFDLSVQKQKWSAFWSFLGTKAGYCFMPSKHVRLQPEVSFGWQRQWNSTDQGLVFSTFAAPFPQVFTTTTKGLKRNSLIFGFDLSCRLYERILIEFDYDLIGNSLFLDNAFYLQGAYQF